MLRGRGIWSRLSPPGFLHTPVRLGLSLINPFPLGQVWQVLCDCSGIGFEGCQTLLSSMQSPHLLGVPCNLSLLCAVKSKRVRTPWQASFICSERLVRSQKEKLREVHALFLTPCEKAMPQPSLGLSFLISGMGIILACCFKMH